MLVNFRQGIVSYPVGFLTKVGTPVGSRVAVNIPLDKPLTLHFAHRGTNYIVAQKTSVGLPSSGAFGPHVNGVDYWLYADINLNTGVVTWNNTTLEPVNQATTPTALQTIISDASPTELVVQGGRHWFKTAPSGVPADDLAYPAYTMFVRNTGNTAWEEKVRVMLAKYEEAANFISVSVNAGSPNAAVRFSGTQAGNLTTNSAGFLIYDAAGVAYKNSNGTFVTTEDVLKTGMLLGADMKIGNYVVQGVAQAVFPAYTIVRFSDFGEVTPVNLFNLDQGFFGLVESAANIGDMVQVIFEGVVTNSAWNWSQANAPLFINNSGVLTETEPSINDAEPVAYAISTTQILLRSSRVEVGLVDHATDVDFGAVRLDAVPAAVAGYLDFDYNGTLTGPTLTGLGVTNTYTAEFLIGTTTKNVAVLGSTATTVTTLLTQLNVDLAPEAVATLVGGNIRVSTVATGPTARVRVSDANIFESVTGFVDFDVPVDGYFDSVAASASGLAAHIANTALHHSTEQDTLLDELDLAGLGIVVKDGEGSMESRSVTSTGASIVVTNGNGVAGNINVEVDDTQISITASQVSDFATAVNAEVAEPLNQIVYGTGTDIDSDPDFTYVSAVDGNNGQFFVNTTTGTGAVGSATSNQATPARVAIYGVTGTQAVTGVGGRVDIWGGYASGGSSSRTGGAVNIWGGGAGGGLVETGGNVNIFGGSQVGSPSSGFGGKIILLGGDTIAGPAGNIELTGGAASNSATSGRIIIKGGTAVGTGLGGYIELTAGSPTDNNGSDVSITASAGVGAVRDGGDVIITAGDSTGAGVAGVINLVIPATGELQINGDAGTSGFVLTSNGSALAPTWNSLATIPTPVTTQTMPYAVLAGDEIVLADGTGNATLPTPTLGRRVIVKNIDIGVVTVIPNAGETIDGAGLFLLAFQFDSVTVVSDGTNWFVI